MATTPAPEAKPALSTRSFLVRLVLAMADLYAVGIIVFLIVWLVSGYQNWVVLVVAYILHWLLLPGIVLFVLAIWKRHWKRTALYIVEVAAFLLLYGELFLPSFSTPPPCEDAAAACPQRLVVMTLNMNFGNGDDDKIVAALRDSGADIIGLQEFNLADATLIRDQLSDVYPYQIQQGDGIPGIGMISRYPITRHEFIKPPTQVHPLVDSEVDVNGVSVRVIVAHPPPPGRVEATGEIASRTIIDTPLFIDLMTEGGPALMLADLNIPDQSQEYTLLREAGLLDAWREEGWGLGMTFPAAPFGPIPPIPLWRIDYIWHTADFKVQAVRLGPVTGSDHLGVVAELLLGD